MYKVTSARLVENYLNTSLGPVAVLWIAPPCLKNSVHTHEMVRGTWPTVIVPFFCRATHMGIFWVSAFAFAIHSLLSRWGPHIFINVVAMDTAVKSKCFHFSEKVLLCTIHVFFILYGYGTYWPYAYMHMVWLCSYGMAICTIRVWLIYYCWLQATYSYS